MTLNIYDLSNLLFNASLAQSGERQTEGLKVPSSILGDRIYFFNYFFLKVSISTLLLGLLFLNFSTM